MAPAPENEPDFEFGYDGQEIGCYECQSGWRHGCCDDMCCACEEAPWCPDAYPCRVCNPLGDFSG